MKQSEIEDYFLYKDIRRTGWYWAIYHTLDVSGTEYFYYDHEKTQGNGRIIEQGIGLLIL